MRALDLARPRQHHHIHHRMRKRRTGTAEVEGTGALHGAQTLTDACSCLHPPFLPPFSTLDSLRSLLLHVRPLALAHMPSATHTGPRTASQVPTCHPPGHAQYCSTSPAHIDSSPSRHPRADWRAPDWRAGRVSHPRPAHGGRAAHARQRRAARSLPGRGVASSARRDEHGVGRRAAGRTRGRGGAAAPAVERGAQRALDDHRGLAPVGAQDLLVLRAPPPPRRRAAWPRPPRPRRWPPARRRAAACRGAPRSARRAWRPGPRRRRGRRGPGAQVARSEPWMRRAASSTRRSRRAMVCSSGVG